jgi:hypothetical protein
MAGMPEATARRIILYPGGHSLPSVPELRTYCDDVQNKWLEYWLKDNSAYSDIASPDSAVVMFDAADNSILVLGLRDSAYWLRPPATPTGRLSAATWHFGDAELSTSLPATGGRRTINYVNLLGSTPAAWRTPPLSEAVTIAGVPGRALLYCDGTGRQYQMELQLWDADPVSGSIKPITRGHYQVDKNSQGQEQLTFDLNPILYTIPSGHCIEARLHSGIPLIPNLDNVFGNFVLGPAVASVNTLSWSAQQPSGFTVYTLDDAPVHAGFPSAAEDLLLKEVWPNPAGAGSPSGSMLVHFSSVSGRENIRLEVFDNLGRRIAVPVDHNTSGHGSVSVDVSALPSGLYHAVPTGTAGKGGRSFMVVR